MEQIITMISTVGFPIAACIGLFCLIQKQLKQVTEAINNNTKVIAILSERLKGGDE